MPTYHVTGMNMTTGEPIDRTVTAANERDARSFLSSERVAVERLEPVASYNDQPARDNPAAAQAAINAAMLEEIRALRKQVKKGASPLRISIVRVGALLLIVSIILLLFI